MRRPSTLRGSARDRHASHLLWWNDDERCAPHCAQRAMGWARLDDSAAVLPEPRWLGAHPVGNDAFAIRSGVLSVVALADGEPELRRFELGDLASDEDDDGHDGERPVTASERVVLPGAFDPVVDAQSVWWTHDETLYAHRDGTTRAYGSGSGWVRVAGPWVWVQSGQLLRDGQSIATMPTSDEVELVAGEHMAWLFAERGSSLEVAICNDSCGPWSVVHESVAQWDATREGTHAWVAYSAIDDPAIRVRQVDERLGAVTLPAPCFDTDVLTGEPSGMCGRPTFGVRDERVFLVAREGGDAWVIERENGPWRPLTGLR